MNASIENEGSEVNRKIWSQSISDATGEYPCGVYKSGVVMCNETQNYLEIYACYCIYWNQDTNETVVGSCIQTCFYTRNAGSFYRIERYFIKNGTLLNKAACSPSTSYVDTHREGHSVDDVNLNMNWQHTPINTPSVYRAQTMGTKTGSSILQWLCYH